VRVSLVSMEKDVWAVIRNGELLGWQWMTESGEWRTDVGWSPEEGEQTEYRSEEYSPRKGLGR